MKQILKKIVELEKLLKEDVSATIYLNNLKTYLNQSNQKLQDSAQESLNFKNSPESKCENELIYSVHSDGGCRGNPGPGAYGFIIENFKNEVIKEDSGFDPMTTNNKMEMTGCLKGLEYLNSTTNLSQSTVTIVSDSQYLINGMKTWTEGWKKRGWKKSDKKEPENLDLWKALDKHKLNICKINYQWVKGHSGHAQNERCDQLVNECMDLNE